MYFPRDSGDKSSSAAGTSSAGTPSSGNANDNNNSDNSQTEGIRSRFIPSADILPAGSMSSFSDVSFGGISLTGILSEVNNSGHLPLAYSPTSINLSEFIPVASTSSEVSSSAGSSSVPTLLSGIPSQLIPSTGIPASGKDSVPTVF
jgi:hypothetical protein